MKSLKKRIELLEERVLALDDILENLLETDISFEKDELVESGISKEWASFELALTLGLGEESIAAYRNIWPSNEGWATAKLYRLREISLKRAPIIEDDVLSEVRSRTIQLRDVLSTNPNAELLLNAITEWREILATASMPYLDSQAEAWLVFTYSFLDTAISSLRHDARRDLTSCVRSYLSNQWLYGWVRGQDERPFGERYHRLFSVAGINPEEPHVSLFGSLDEALRGLDNREIHQSIDAALRRLAEILAQDGLEGLFDILEDDGSIFDSPGVDGKGLINVIPGHGDGHCRPILFAFAKSGNARSQFGTAETMRRVREHLIQCQGRTQVVFFFAPLDSLGKTLEGSIGDLDAHMRQGGLRVFAPVAIFNRRMSMILWQ